MKSILPMFIISRERRTFRENKNIYKYSYITLGKSFIYFNSFMYMNHVGGVQADGSAYQIGLSDR